MADPFIFAMQQLHKSYGQRKILENINLCFYAGAKIGVVGDNGAGKSTVLRIMAGIDRDFEGHAEPMPGVRVGMLQQDPKLDPALSVRENVEQAFAETKSLLTQYDEVSAKMSDPDLDPDAMQEALDEMAKLQDRIDAVNGWELDRMVDVAADALVLPPDEVPVEKLSGGERRRVALCRILLEKPDILLLDEPTNHLDAETVEWLEGQLRDYPGTVIIVTHDRYFLDNITKWILELERGKGLPFEGNYSSWVEQKIQILAHQEKKESPRRQSLERELKWIRMSREGRSEYAHARLKDYEGLLVSARQASESSEVIEIPSGERLGDTVVEFKDVTKGYRGVNLIENLSFTLPRGGVVGVVGPNGAGKSTLFKMIKGEEKSDSGQVVIGETVEMAYADQHRAGLDSGKTVYEEISEGNEDIELGNRRLNARAYVSRFNFKGGDQQKKVGDLSGGERNRLYLAKVIKRGGNLIMLDEPTNDLDVNSLRMLEDAIHRFDGCLMVISHDRFFLDRVCTHLLVFEGEGKVRWFEGNFSDYEAAKKAEHGDKAFANRRSKYRRLTID